MKARPPQSVPQRSFTRVGPKSRRAAVSHAGRQLWPPVAVWRKCQESAKEKVLRNLGISPNGLKTKGEPASQALLVLGADSFVDFTVVRSPGKVIWFNFDLARRLGIGAPPGDQMTPDFEQRLLRGFSYRTLPPGEVAPNEERVTMYADRYGGDGVRPKLGAARAGFLSERNLYVKGIGFTPLFKDGGPDDFVHSHGGVQMEDCLAEALFGEVNENLFALGSSRVLAIIDQDRYVTAPSGKQLPLALVVRAGAHLRPAHLLVNHSRRNGSVLKKFVSMARATGQLVTRPSATEQPDVMATMLRIIDDQARTAADGFRWRMIHGALSSSNMEMSGAMLDVPTQSSQPRTAPVWLLDYIDCHFGSEHLERAVQLIPVYRKLVRNTPEPRRKRLNFRPLDVRKEMERAYRKHLQIKLISACGLKTAVARRINLERPELSRRFTDLILSMAGLKNPGPVCIARSVVEDISVLDVFHLLKSFPAVYFQDPSAAHTEAILEYLRPLFRGNRFHIAKKRAAVDLLVDAFAKLYRELMEACAGYAGEYYGGIRNMQASVSARAAFENEPIEALYYFRLQKDLKEAIAGYKSTARADIVRDSVDQRVSASLRSVDGLLAQGERRRMRGGGIELEIRMIGGVRYSVRAWNDQRQKRRLHVCIPAARDGDGYSIPVDGVRLTTPQIKGLHYRFTTDGWKTWDRVRAQLRVDGQYGFIIDFDDIVTFPSVGRLEGRFELAGGDNLGDRDGPPIIGPYIFAVPDKHELIEMVTGTVRY